jgi:hypothetical protein
MEHSMGDEFVDRHLQEERLPRAVVSTMDRACRARLLRKQRSGNGRYFAGRGSVVCKEAFVRSRG